MMLAPSIETRVRRARTAQLNALFQNKSDMANAKSKRLIHAVVHGNALKAVAGIQKPVAVVESSAMWPRDVNESVIVERKRSKLQKVTGL